MRKISSMTIFVHLPKRVGRGRTAEANTKLVLRRKSTMTSFLRNLWTDDQGQDLIEYTLLMAFVALGSAVLFMGAGTSVSMIWSTTNAQLSAAAAGAS